MKHPDDSPIELNYHGPGGGAHRPLVGVLLLIAYRFSKRPGTADRGLTPIFTDTATAIYCTRLAKRIRVQPLR